MELKLNPTNSRFLRVYDVSNLIYAYTKSVSKIKSRNTTHVSGLNISGITGVMNMIAKDYKNNVRTVLAMDSFSDKKRNSSVYKANRVFHPEMAVQSDIIYEYFKSFGVDIIRIPGYEADDIIYSVVKSNLDEYNYIFVHTNDHDIYGCVLNDNVNIVGTTADAPSFNKFTYPSSVSTKMEVEYNTILPNIVFYGKPSNNLAPLKLSASNKYCFNKYVEWLKSSGLDMSTGSNEDVFNTFLIAVLEGNVENLTFTEDDINSIMERKNYVFPKIIDIPIKNKANDIDAEIMLQFMQLYKQTSAADIMGLSNTINKVQPNEAMRMYLKRMFAVVKNGTYNTDNGLDATILPVPTSTNEFTSIEDW